MDGQACRTLNPFMSWDLDTHKPGPKTFIPTPQTRDCDVVAKGNDPMQAHMVGLRPRAGAFKPKAESGMRVCTALFLLGATDLNL